MECPKCGSSDVTIQMVEKGAKVKKSGLGLGGHAFNAARGVLAVSTLGLSNIVVPKAKGQDKKTSDIGKFCLCQSCGHSWEIKVK